MSNESPTQGVETPRQLSSFAAVAVVMGSILGIGIFLVPPTVAAHAGSFSGYLGLWIVGGVLALAGANACAELGAMMPKAGGDYVFQREAFGPSVAFASGWVLFGAVFTGSMAAIAVPIFEYQLTSLLGIDFSTVLFAWPWGTPFTGAQAGAIGLILFLTFLNSMSARTWGGIQILLTAIPFVILVAAAIYAIAAGPINKIVWFAGPGEGFTLQGLVIAYLGVYFAYSGWNAVIYVAGEVRKPERSIPRSLLWGTLAVTALYVLLCSAYVRVLGMDGLKNAGEAGTATAGIIGGHSAEVMVTVLIAIALLASLNGTILGGARVAFAMARHGVFWKKIATFSKDSGVPKGALWVQALWAIALVTSGRFEDLLNLASLAMLVTGSLTVASLFVLRRTMAEQERPFRAFWYPWFPGLYLVASILIIAVMVARALSGEPGAWYPLLGLGIFVVAFTGHFINRNRDGSAPRSLSPENLPSHSSHSQ